MASIVSTRPRVSVVIPVNNRAHLLGRAIQSVVAQSFPDFELIVIDDGSTDDPEAVATAFSDPRIRFLRLPGHFGAARARNDGVRASRGRWIAFLDSDDEWLPAKLERQLDRLLCASDPGAIVVYCLSYYNDHFTGQINVTPTSLHEGDVFDHLLRGWVLPTTSVALIDRSALLAVGGFTEALPSRQDYDLWLKLAEAGNCFIGVADALVIKHENYGEQIVADPAARLLATSYMRERWGPTVRQRHGLLAYYRWLSDGRAIVQRAQLIRVKNALSENRRNVAWRYCAAMIRFLPWSRRFFFQALFLLLCGKNSYAALRAFVLKPPVRNGRTPPAGE